MKLLSIALLIAIMLFLPGSGCKKDGNACWQAAHPGGGDVSGLLLCDKTKEEAETSYPQYWFYKQGEAKYCWRIVNNGNTYYAVGITESIANRYQQLYPSYQYSKVNCGSFCNIQWIEKHKGKLTGFYGPTRVIVETILSSDSCSKLYIGRIITYRETTDSLITREVSEKEP